MTATNSTEAQLKDKRVTKESPKSMGKEASKHKGLEQTLPSTALKVPIGGELFDEVLKG